MQLLDELLSQAPPELRDGNSTSYVLIFLGRTLCFGRNFGFRSGQRASQRFDFDKGHGKDESDES